MARKGWQIDVLSGPEYGPAKNIELVQNKKVTFAIANNSNIYSEDQVTTVATLNMEVILMLYHNIDKKPSSIEEMLSGRKVLLPERHSEPRRIISRIFKMLDIDTTSFETTYITPDMLNLTSDEWITEISKYDVCIIFSELENPNVKKLLRNGWRFYSEPRQPNLSESSIVDAFCYKYPWAFPVKVPRKIFGRHQPNSFKTIGIKSLIVTHEDTNPMLVYDFLMDYNNSLPIISKKRVAFAQARNLEKEGLLSYPLHAGSIRYRDREKPKFAERYAELIALIVTLAAIGSGLTARYMAVLKQSKKDHIDRYYSMLQAARTLEELEEVRARAIKQLQDEKLAANDSFIIFLMLYEELKAEMLAQGTVISRS
ncbi:MAG TPA: hypothetical protein ENJ39_04010 [Flammeovirgaceae bacterium]|nr:hypothetical protein [Flammeovirgaceae bacterium]